MSVEHHPHRRDLNMRIEQDAAGRRVSVTVGVWSLALTCAIGA